VPILVQGEVVGVINMSHSRPSAFEEETVARVALFGLPIASVAMRAVLRRDRERMATTDTLTSLYNKRHFDQSLEVEVGRAKRYGHKVSVLVLDVDRPREPKSKTGPSAGEQILSDMGRLLKRSARTTDCIARYGYDEFRILLPHTDENRAKVAAERLRGVVEKHAFPRRRRPTVHIGIATYPTDSVLAPVTTPNLERAVEAVMAPPLEIVGPSEAAAS
jgi:diguanylate cyclase (GGDEF)-like protein